MSEKMIAASRGNLPKVLSTMKEEKTKPSDRLQGYLTGKLRCLADFEEVVDNTHLSEFRQISSCLISRLLYHENRC